MTPAEVLRAAADRVQFHGWTQFSYAVTAPNRAGGLRKTTGTKNPHAVAWCAQGALKAESETDALYRRTLKALENQLGRTGIPYWNDAPGRTAGEVADAMRRAAKTLENEV